MKILSWNIQSFKSNHIWLQQVVKDFDIILLQETWLYNFEHNLIERAFPNFKCFSASSMPSSKSCNKGRPYGGTAILIKNNLSCAVKETNTSDPRAPSVLLETDKGDLLIINVYFPCNSRENDELITKYFGLLESRIMKHSCDVIVAGDFNISIGCPKFNEFKLFCNDLELSIEDVTHLPAESFTFISKSSNSVSWIDHCVANRNTIKSVSLPYLSCPSDHIPLVFHCDNICVTAKVQSNPGNIPKGINWRRVSTGQKRIFDDCVARQLRKYNWDICTKKNCMSAQHHVIITEKTNLLISILQKTAEHVFGYASSRKYVEKQVCGWNELVRPFYEDYRRAFKIWIDSGRNCADKYNTMCLNRKKFKISLRRCKKLRNQRLHDDLVMSYTGKDFVKFWRHVRNQDSNQQQSPSADNVDGVYGDREVAEHWASIYKNLFNLNQSTEKESNVRKYIDKRSKDSCASWFSDAKVVKAIYSLKLGKAKGPDGLRSEHFKYACLAIVPVFKVLVNAMFAHGFVPECVMTVYITPILKKRGASGTISCNYRPIAIATTFSKVLELLILKECGLNLRTCDNQFGYKRGVGTELAVYSVKQIAHHYVRSNSPAYICYMDATKAFDMVNHYGLLNKLCDRNFPYDIIRLLLYWFRNQKFAVRWNNCISATFSVLNSVRQGGILSAYFFAVYIDELSVRLTKSGYGCKIGESVTNNIMYADDICLLAGSVSSLKILISICEEYADSHDLVFNPTKTVCQCFSKIGFFTASPMIMLKGKILKWVATVRYLGYDINCHDRDYDEIMRRRREIYARANLLSSRFGSCSHGVKLYLFNTYFSSIYCSSLWVPVRRTILDKLKTAYNDAFRILFGYSRRSSASEMFCENACRDFYAMRRSAAYSLLKRIANSDNSLIVAILYSDCFFNSSITYEWKRILF